MFESTFANKTSAITKNNSGRESKVQQKKESSNSLSGIISSAASGRYIQFITNISKKDDTHMKETDQASDKIVLPSSSAGLFSLKIKPVENKSEALSDISHSKEKQRLHGTAAKEPVNPETILMPGSSENLIENFTRSGASLIAAAFPSLGKTIEKKLQSEQQETAASVTSLKAQTNGVKVHQMKNASKPEKMAVEIKKGAASPEPPKQEIMPQKNFTPPPDNIGITGQLDKKESGGFFSWFRNIFTDFISSISIYDPGVNTSAGPAPKMNLSGDADPGRAGNQRSQGDEEVNKGNSETVNAIQSNPGKENIQPVKVDESKKSGISKDTKIKIESKEQSGMQDYLEIKYPADMRNAADKKMAPLLEKDLSKQREDVLASAKKRDNDKHEAITNSQNETEKLNREAEKSQNEAVVKFREEVDARQKAGMKEADNKRNEFNKEADTEQSESLKQIRGRADKDQADADTKLSDAEKEAEAEKRKGEEEARKKKVQLEKESKNQSWWDRAVNAVKSAVKAITSAIDAVFNAVRKAVKFIIDKAKNAALAVIEAGRKWIIDKLDKFGKWLKDKVNKYLSAFPALAKRINAAIDATVNKAKAAVNYVADKLKNGVEALANKLANAIDSVLSKFQTALKAAVQITGALLTGDFAEALKIAFFAACEIAGIDPNPIINFLEYAGDTIKIIFKDPVGFIINVAKGVKKGLDQFLTNIKKHLLNGVIQWLTGAISEAGITLPEKFNLKGIFSLVMQILGLTYQNIRAKVVKKLGPNGEEIVSKIESGFEFVKELIAKGPIALWDRVKDSLSNLKDTVLSEVRDWLITSVIKEGIIWLISLLNPASAIAKALKMLYDVVMFLIERYKQIVDFVKSIFESVGALARGSLDKAANAVENALARSVTVVISFMASLLGLGGVGKTIKNIIEKIRKPVDTALEKVIGWIAEKGKALFAAGKSLLQKGKEKLLGKGKNEEKENPLTAESNKKEAARKVRNAMVHGIRKSDLIKLLSGLQKEYNLKSATLNDKDDAVIYNSDPVTLKGKEITDAPAALALKQGEKKLEKDPGGNIKLGTFTPSYVTEQTLKGVIQKYTTINDTDFPIGNLPAAAARPTAVKTVLTGVIKKGLAANIERDSALTVTVGDLGDIESALRNNIQSVPKKYHGGHIIASKFGGPESFKNLVPQAIPINLGLYKRMEDFVGDNLKEIDKSGNVVSVVENSVDITANMIYGEPIHKDLTGLILSISRKTFGHEWNKINKMPEATEMQKKNKENEKKKLGDKEEYFNKVKGGDKKIDVKITPWIPIAIKANVQMDSLVPVAEEDTRKYYQDTRNEGAESKMIYAEDVKLDEKGEMKTSNKINPKKEKKKWSATFEFSQKNNLK